ncbi:DUF948 domain-containing protein [Cellulomonas sp. P24]|jgi:uncharacterized protein YoxC|uniref:DUF948 domain-containing protein n=1 Tax=Cellulomonas sp. P24 TaxID=2885206 RepID=UPI00216ADA77|nr:DUF948 domain-containing protein [Cellulomonas sp. P24]MCR6494591.1 DUF948 domain-containing protein [Cellulomonas sp. P24]
MSLGDVAGLISALAFVALVILLARPLLRLGGVFDETRESVRQLTEHTVPVLDETAATVASANAQLARVDTITSSVADVTQNVSALTSLFAATVGSPLIKVAAFSYGARRALAGIFRSRR